MKEALEYDYQSEVVRKSGEALSWLENEHRRGAISDDAAFTALTMFDKATLGLIPEEYSDWVREKRQSLGTSGYYMTLMRNSVSKAVAVIVTNTRTEKVTLIATMNGKQKEQEFDFSQELDGVVAASGHSKLLVSKMKKLGFEEYKS